VSAVAAKTGRIPLGPLNGAYQFTFIRSAGFEVMLSGNFFDRVDFHCKTSLWKLSAS
jgi:hypothetical protein